MRNRSGMAYGVIRPLKLDGGVAFDFAARTQELAGDMTKDSGAADRNEALHLKDEEIGEEIVDVANGLKGWVLIIEEMRGEVRGIDELLAHLGVPTAKASGGIGDWQAAAAAQAGALATAGWSRRGCRRLYVAGWIEASGCFGHG